MADGIILEQHGIQAASILTDAFLAAGNAMARRYGLTGYRYVTLPHPVENLSREESKERVATIMDEILSILGVLPTGGKAGPGDVRAKIDSPQE